MAEIKVTEPGVEFIRNYYVSKCHNVPVIKIGGEFACSECGRTNNFILKLDEKET